MPTRVLPALGGNENNPRAVPVPQSPRDRRDEVRPRDRRGKRRATSRGRGAMEPGGSKEGTGAGDGVASAVPGPEPGPREVGGAGPAGGGPGVAPRPQTRPSGTRRPLRSRVAPPPLGPGSPPLARPPRALTVLRGGTCHRWNAALAAAPTAFQNLTQPPPRKSRRSRPPSGTCSVARQPPRARDAAGRGMLGVVVPTALRPVPLSRGPQLPGCGPVAVRGLLGTGPHSRR